jgi:hypothetical protein
MNNNINTIRGGEEEDGRSFNNYIGENEDEEEDPDLQERSI